jgi:hypothetical protein
MITNGLFSTSRPLGITYFETLVHQTMDYHKTRVWRELLERSTIHSRQTIVLSLLSNLPLPSDHYACDAAAVESIQESETLLGCYFATSSQETMALISQCLRKLHWPVALCRVVLLWENHTHEGPSASKLNAPLERTTLLDAALEHWEAQEHIRHSPLSHHQSTSYFTISCMILTIKQIFLPAYF